MSPATQFVVLALASASSVLAIPYAGHHGHAALHRAHRREAPPAYGSSSSSSSVAAAVPYPFANGTATHTSQLSPQSPTLIPSGYSSSTSIANAVPTAYGSSSTEAGAVPGTFSSSTAPGSSSSDDVTTSTVHKTSTRTAYTTVYLSMTSSTGASRVPASSVADSISAAPYKEVKQAAAVSEAHGDAAQTTEADQCGAVTYTATEKVTEYITVFPSSSSSSVPLSPMVSASNTSTLRAANSTQYAPTAYSSASYSLPLPSSNSSVVDAVPATSTSAPSAPAYSAPASSAPSSSSEAAAVPTSAPSAPVYSAPSAPVSSAASAPSAPAYSAPSSSSSSEAAPVATSESSKTSSSTTTAALIPTQYVNKGVADVDAVATSSAAAPASYSSTASSSGGKRGLAYNDATLTDCFTDSSEITWAYNWGSSAGDIASHLSFIPTLWGTRSDFTDSWSENAKSAISSGSKTLFSFNEPDLPAQANLSPAAAAAAYKTYMQPLAGSAELCAPSVTNSGTDGQGLSWLTEFLEHCSDCQIDCLNIHWYDSAENINYFKSHIEQATALANGKPVYLSEFGASGSDEQISTFLQEVMPWMDSNSDIAGYAYFMVSSGVLVTGTEPSTYGSVYKSYTA